jgi:phage-related protein
MTYFVFDGVDSRSFGVYLFDVETDSAPANSYNELTVPGRNGSLLMSNKRYPNIAHSYDAIIASNYDANLAGFKACLLSKIGYKRLEDDDHADEYYKAVYRSMASFKTLKGRGAGRVRVTFDRKPERYLKSGETVTTLSANGSIINPTAFDSKPLIRIYGSGDVGIGSSLITVLLADGYTDIDCEAMECYKGTVSMNSMVSFSGNDFPVLHAGSNGITLGAGITKVEITPRWWRL